MNWQTTVAGVRLAILIAFLVAIPLAWPIQEVAAAGVKDDLTAGEMAKVREMEQRRIAAIEKVVGSVVAIYDLDRQGGGSGVIIDRSGIALTNHHVIMGAGIEGWAGLADGHLYRWTLIGTDPGGDVAIIELEGKEEFPTSALGDSDNVKVGDWALAMGNPFILTEDQKPTITLGIVSGVKRYQPGSGTNQLVYGNCIQVDSSINPGNSGGPLFNLDGEVIGINGRGSFLARGRVNVGLGYAISSNQIKNFLPDLLATKLVEHGTMDASFSDRGGKVVCSTINEDSPVAKAGLGLGDELLEFEGIPIRNANQYTNLICTLPEDWPAQLKIRTTENEERVIDIRLFGLPYQKPNAPKMRGNGKEKPTPEQEKQMQRAKEMFELLAATPGTIRSLPVNALSTQMIFLRWREKAKLSSNKMLQWTDEIKRGEKTVGHQTFSLAATGEIRIKSKLDGEKKTLVFDGKSFASWVGGGKKEGKLLTLTEAKLDPQFSQAFGILAASGGDLFSAYGKPYLDGGDKAQGRSAYRFKLLDDEEDWFYFWVNLVDDEGKGRPELAKVSADKDCDRKQGGFLFKDWVDVGRFRFSRNRFQIRGLGETVVLSYLNKRVDLLVIERESFDIPEWLSSPEKKQ